MSSNDQPRNLERRKFFAVAGAAAGTFALAGLTARTAKAADLPHVKETDAIAVSMNFKNDTTKVDAKKFPNHKNDQMCSNCQFYQGGPTGYGPCQIFAGKSVPHNGWCQVWAKKA